jgi:hypothetical protein
VFFRIRNFVYGISVENSYSKPRFFFVLKTELEFKNINFAYVCLENPFGDN